MNHLKQLESMLQDLLQEAQKQGASAAEAAVSSDQGLSVTVRLGETETVEQTRDQGLGVTVYMGQHKGSASTTDFSANAIIETVRKACTIARYTSEDPYTGLGDPDRMAMDYPDLDLYHPWDIRVEQAAKLALDCEQAARDADSRITNSEGATLNTHSGSFIYGNTHGFVGGYPFSRHSLSCVVMAQEGESMQRDYWYSSERLPDQLDNPASIGREAASRTVRKLHARKLSTRQAPVIFRADIAPGLLMGLMSAVSGHAQYRKSSFLLDSLDQQLFPSWVRIHENPLLPRGMSSAPFDNEGIATSAKEIVRDGVLQTYILDSYSARKLDMQSTGNAGGVKNLAIEPGDLDLPALLKEMNTGLLVTELMGQGLNPVTGDYSRGAAGLWVEDGEIQYPVEEITIAGNMRDMYQQLVAVGKDIDNPGSISTGSWLFENMTIAGE
jgi:PmbA protein